MKTQFMIYDRSLKAFQKYFPKSVFEGYENSFGSKCWVSIENVSKFEVIRICTDKRIKVLRIETE